MQLLKELWTTLTSKTQKETKEILDVPEKEYQPWSKLEEQMLMGMHADNVDDITIAVALNRTVGAVYQRRMKLNREK